MDSLRLDQNSDGGWPYRRGGPSWTEPTVFALLAGSLSGDHDLGPGRARALDWLRALQQPDGGWSPKPGVAQSTWVTALVALLPVNELGAANHAKAIRWLAGQTPANATLLYRLQCWLHGKDLAEPDAG